jgi:hypothetical protein
VGLTARERKVVREAIFEKPAIVPAMDRARMAISRSDRSTSGMTTSGHESRAQNRKAVSWEANVNGR